MRMTELCLVAEVKEEYLELRRDGRDRQAATEELMERYIEEITIGAEDDGLQFWVGLADGQYANRELTAEIAGKAREALDAMEQTDWEITPGDLRRRREHYRLAPMPEKKMGKPRPKFRCQWQIGDTFAYRLTGSYAEQSGTAGAYILLRKANELDGGNGKIFPTVYLSLWEKEELPRTLEEYRTAPLMRLDNGRFAIPREYYEYRAVVIIDSKKQLESMPLTYLGNFHGADGPDDEVVIDEPGSCAMLFLKQFDRDLNMRVRKSRRYEKKL